MPGPAVGDPDALVAALIELDRQVGRNGWDTPPRLFALVLNDVLAATEPQLSAELRLGTADPGALTAIEQDEFVSSGDLTSDLAHLEWPESVYGCAGRRPDLPAFGRRPRATGRSRGGRGGTRATSAAPGLSLIHI